MTLADEIRGMVFAFDRNDSRRADVRDLADRVAKLDVWRPNREALAMRSTSRAVRSKIDTDIVRVEVTNEGGPSAETVYAYSGEIEVGRQAWEEFPERLRVSGWVTHNRAHGAMKLARLVLGAIDRKVSK